MPSRPTEYQIHITDLNEFKRCRRAWYWSSPLGLHLEPIGGYAPFFLGTLVHYALEAHYKWGSDPNQALAGYFESRSGWSKTYVQCLAELPEKLYGQVPLAIGIVDHYLEWQKYDQTWLADREFEFVEVEYPIERALWSNTRRKIVHAGRLDGIVRHKATDKYYLWELKTTSSIKSRTMQLDTDSQADAYLSSAQAVLPYSITGLIYTLMRKELPVEPKVLQNGNLSINSRIDSSAEHFTEFAKKHHNNDRAMLDQYGSIVQELLSQPNKFFSRVVVQRSQAELAHSQADFLATAHDMINPNLPLYANDSPHCNGCLFRKPCLAYRRGQDYQAILAAEYQTKQDRIEDD